MIKEKHADLQQSRTSALSEQIIQIQSQLAAVVLLRQKTEQDLQTQIDQLKAGIKLAAEVLLRQKTEQDLQTQIDQLKAGNESLIRSRDEVIRSRDEGQRVMLIRALGTSFQYALTQKFPGVFTTKYPYSCTFNDIDKKITALHDTSYDAILADMKSFFSARGIENSDINALIKTIREVGTATSHLTEMIDANAVAYKPSAADLREVINVVQLPETIKADARILLDALDSIVPASRDLLYRI
jgi:ribosomal protein L29